MDIAEYLITYCDQPSGNADRQHHALLNDLMCKRRILRIPPGAQMYREVAMLDQQGIVTGQVDIVAYHHPQLFLIEGKVDRERTDKSYQDHRDKIREQLGRAFEYFSRHFGIYAEAIGVIRPEGATVFNPVRLRSRDRAIAAWPVDDIEAMLDIADLVQHPPREK